MRQKISLVVTLLAVAACSGAEKPSGDGSAGAGAAGVGGASGAGGSSGSAGTSAGGTSGAGAGGAAGQAGTAGVGGAGGSAGVGGAGTGGAGGAGAGGLGGAGAGGAGGAGGLGGSGGIGGGSTGCGKEWNPANAEIETRQGRVPVRVVTESQMIAGIQREWIVAAPTPENYDPNKAYPVVFGWHGQGGTRTQLRGYLNLEQPAGVEAIFIYPSGLPLDPSDPADTGWPPGKEEDLALVDALLERYAAEVCIDRGRVFATGHSYGGIMSQNVGCARGNIFRGIAPVAGGLWGQRECQGQVAALMIHSPKDTATSYSGEIGMCTEWLRKNTCDENPACGCHWVSELEDPADECVQMAQEPYATNVEITTSDMDDQPPELRSYLNCDADYPVAFADHWRREGRDPERWHNPPPWSGALIWEFFSKLGSVPPEAPRQLESQRPAQSELPAVFRGWLPEEPGR